MKFKLSDKLKALFFIVAWLIPITWLGMLQRNVPFAPSYMNDLYGVSCLFPQRASHWSHYYFHVKTKNSDEWIELAESDLSQHQPFGRRSRIKRMLEVYTDKNVYEKRKVAISQFARKRFETLYPDKGLVTEIEITQVWFPVGGKIANPEGHWKKPPFNDTPEKQRMVINLQSFEK